MATQSSVHVYLNWAKERLDEMDATLASFESKVGQLRGDVRAKAESTLADMRARGDAFRETIKKEREANEAAWARVKAALEAREGLADEGHLPIAREIFRRQQLELRFGPDAVAPPMVVHVLEEIRYPAGAGFRRHHLQLGKAIEKTGNNQPQAVHPQFHMPSPRRRGKKETRLAR